MASNFEQHDDGAHQIPEEDIKRHEAIRAATGRIMDLAVEITSTTDLNGTDIAFCLKEAAKHITHYQ